MIGLEPRSSDVSCNSSTNCSTTTAKLKIFFGHHLNDAKNRKRLESYLNCVPQSRLKMCDMYFISYGIQSIQNSRCDLIQTKMLVFNFITSYGVTSTLQVFQCIESDIQGSAFHKIQTYCMKSIKSFNEEKYVGRL